MGAATLKAEREAAQMNEVDAMFILAALVLGVNIGVAVGACLAAGIYYAVTKAMRR